MTTTETTTDRDRLMRLATMYARANEAGDARNRIRYASEWNQAGGSVRGPHGLMPRFLHADGTLSKSFVDAMASWVVAAIDAETETATKEG